MIRYIVFLATAGLLCLFALSAYTDSAPERIRIEFTLSNSLTFGDIVWSFRSPKNGDGKHLYSESIHNIPYQMAVTDTFFMCLQQHQALYQRNLTANDPLHNYRIDGKPLYSDTYVDCIISACLIDDPQLGERIIVDVNNDEDLTNDPILVFRYEKKMIGANEYDLYSIDTEAMVSYYDGSKTVNMTVPLRFRKRVSEDRCRYEYRFNLIQVGTIEIDGRQYRAGWPLAYDIESYRDEGRWITPIRLWIDLNQNEHFEYDDFNDEVYEPFTLLGKTYQGVAFDRFARHLVIEKLDTETHPPVAVGLPVPVFSAETLDGNCFDLAAQKGRYVLLDFWGSWCGPCIGDLPHLKEAHERFGDTVRFVGIAVEDDRHGLEQCIAEHGIEWTQIHKTSQDPLPELYQIEGYPSLFLIGPDGTLVDKTYLRHEHLIPTLEKHIR